MLKGFWLGLDLSSNFLILQIPDLDHKLRLDIRVISWDLNIAYNAQVCCLKYT